MAAIKIAGATVNQTPLDWEGNLNRILGAVDQAKSEQVEILCLPELAITGYGSEDLFLSYWYPKKAQDQLAKLIPHCTDITVDVVLPVRIQDKVYNTVAVLEDAKLKSVVPNQKLAIVGVHYAYHSVTP